ncbi:MAG: hypothetical protein NT040_10725 [Bacteroidetes bacterium]|nr:hypothetical protein [Bacteroidota bacterium]
MRYITSKSLFLFLCSIIYIASVSAQDTIPSLTAKPRQTDSFWHRVSVGGNIGVQFGSVTGISISPEVRIRTVDQLNVGLRFIYQYYYTRNYFYDTENKQDLPYKSNVYGGAIYLRYYLSSFFDNFLGNIFAHAEYEYLSYVQPYMLDSSGKIVDSFGNTYTRGNNVIEVNSIFVGGGYRQPLSNRVAMDFLILFNLNDSFDSPYSNPIFRLGVGVGL